MSNQYPNPVRGYVPCAHCHAPSTVHSVGEGKLIATGETPKNARNIGKLYYKCPDCGNQTPSNKVSEYITAHQVDSQSELQQVSVTDDSVKDNALVTGNSVTDENALTNEIKVSEGGSSLDLELEGELIDKVTLESISESVSETSKTNVSSVNENVKKESHSFITWVVVVLVLLGSSWLLWQMLKPKTDIEPKTGVSHG
ncbi:hypothetical protein [Vibrio scophthalmi]|uniref:Uncharacterized protein n=1 Tax=Vibrio scophthalmi TaxID=45658 RepID=A0A1E3WJY1_9VIBR|nr:hypothetical protein [Vibrio scophthalmi]ODS10086.1 hypothetical protein VSF3289_00324 [Vibrio scophthalmi]